MILLWKIRGIFIYLQPNIEEETSFELKLNLTEAISNIENGLSL